MMPNRANSGQWTQDDRIKNNKRSVQLTQTVLFEFNLAKQMQPDISIYAIIVME